jgi:hypothetical protein
LISGTPTASGDFSFTVMATDTDADSVSQVCTLTVARADLFVIDNPNSKRYGQTASDSGALIGVVNGDGITATFASSGDAATAPVGSGSDAISATLSDPNHKLSNYTVIETHATLTINQVDLTITANDATKFAGQANPPFSARYSGFVNGENASVLGGSLTFNTTATTSSGAGTYPITVSAVAANYRISYVNGTLTVNPAQSSGPVLTEQIGDGNAQRSMVSSITLTFASPIASTQLGTVLANLSLTMTANDATDPGPFISTANPSQLKLAGALDPTGAKLTLTFTGSSILGGSLPDGRYNLCYGGNTLLGANQLWRLYGDLCGTGSITSGDVTAFNTAYGINGSRKGLPGYNAYLDYYANGLINFTDKQQFQCRVGTSI